MINKTAIRIIAPVERYTPLLLARSSLFMDLVSVRNAFFSTELRVDLSIAFISFSLESSIPDLVGSSPVVIDTKRGTGFVVALI